MTNLVLRMELGLGCLQEQVIQNQDCLFHPN